MTGWRRTVSTVGSVDQLPDSVLPTEHMLRVFERGGTFDLVGPRMPAFEHWRPIIMERCPVEASWGGDLDGNERLASHSAFAGRIWDTIDEALPARTVVVDMHDAGLTDCDDERCFSGDCTVARDVTDHVGVVRRVDVPI